MKKVIAFILLIVTVISCFMLTGCNDGEQALTQEKLLAPGEHQITGVSGANSYSNIVIRAVGKDREYIAKVDNGKLTAYGYKTIGFSMNVVPKYIYEATFTDCTIVYSVSMSYSNYLSSLSSKQTLTETIYFMFYLDEKGYLKEVKYAKPVLDENGNTMLDKHHNEIYEVDEDKTVERLGTITFDSKNKIAYFYFNQDYIYDENNLYCPLAINPKLVVAAKINTSGKVTFAPRETDQSK